MKMGLAGQQEGKIVRVLDLAGEKWIANDLVRGGLGRWEIGETCEVHLHEGAAEFFVVLDGTCAVQIDEEVKTTRAGKGVYVGPVKKHNLTAVGDRPLIIFMVVAPTPSPSHTFYKQDGTPVH